MDIFAALIAYAVPLAILIWAIVWASNMRRAVRGIEETLRRMDARQAGAAPAAPAQPPAAPAAPTAAPAQPLAAPIVPTPAAPSPNPVNIDPFVD